MVRSVNHTSLALLALMLAMLCGSLAFAATTEPGLSWDNIGEVRGDTLYVSRDCHRCSWVSFFCAPMTP